MTFRAAAVAGDASTATTNNRSITIPATAVAGDVAVLFVDSTSNPNLTTPTGWTLESGPDGGTGTARAWCLSRDITASGTGSPGSSVSIGFSFASVNAALMLVFSGRTRTGLQVGATVQDTATATLTLPTLTGVPSGADLAGGALRRRTGTAPTITATGYTTPTNGEFGSNMGSGAANVFGEAAYVEGSGGGSVGGTSWSVSGSTISVGTNYLVSIPAGVTEASAALSGTGTLSTTQAPAFPRSAAFGGSGTLSTTQALTVARAAALSGSGTLSTTQTLAVARTAALSGSGELNVTALPGWTKPAGFAGSGVLIASTFGFVSGLYTGNGVLTATVSPAWIKAAALSGSGSLVSVLALVGVQLPAGLSGSGTLVSTTPAQPVGAILSGSGTLVAHQVQALRLGTRLVTDLRLSTIRPLRVYRGSALVWQ